METIKPNLQRTPQLLRILQYPNDTLSKVSKPVMTSIADSQSLQDLLDDMVATARAYNALGLAAIQIGVPLRVMVVHDGNDYIKIINPNIIEASGSEFVKEGCLSLPGLYLRIQRPKEVVVKYFNEKGEQKETVANDLVARAILHEADHLDGLTFIDKLNKIEKVSALKKFKTLKRKFT